jgi:RNA-directed DNA polymerase
LDGLERKLEEKFPKTTRRGRLALVHLIRYADDFIITGRTKQLLEQEVQPLIEEFLRERGLELSKEKTQLTHIEEGFDFLGQNVQKYQGKLLIKPSKKKVKEFLGKIRELIKTNPQATAGALIEKLNPKIRGWANYHRQVVSKRTFQEVDSEIFQALWQWAKRRHPNKKGWWIKKKYFRRQGGRQWSFFGKATKKKREEGKIDLMQAVSIPIKRHIKIKSEANPYDPTWESYFDQRLARKWQQGKKRSRLVALWKEQEGNCLICYEKITKETGWNLHHKLHRVHGGDDSLMNLILLHPNCHRQVHNRGWKVGKLGLEKGLRKA